VIPERAARRIGRRADAEQPGNKLGFIPGLGVTGPITAPIAPPGELAAMPTLRATLTDDIADPPGKLVRTTLGEEFNPVAISSIMRGPGFLHSAHRTEKSVVKSG
jgi:hypothetical protein